MDGRCSSTPPIFTLNQLWLISLIKFHDALPQKQKGKKKGAFNSLQKVTKVTILVTFWSV